MTDSRQHAESTTLQPCRTAAAVGNTVYVRVACPRYPAASYLCRRLSFVTPPHHTVKIRPRKACRYPNLRSFEWVSYDKVGVLYSGELGSRSEARASDLRSYPGLWWKRIKLYLYEETKVSTLRGPAQLTGLQGPLCVPHPLI